MPIQRTRHGATIVNGKMYLVGGRDINDIIIQTVDVYDSFTNSWSTMNQLWTQANSDNVAVSLNSEIFAISGYDQNYDSLNSTCILNLLSNPPNWQCDTVKGMNYGRGDACGIVLDKEVYVLGGFSDYNWCESLNTMEIYDLLTNTWRLAPNLHNDRADAACAALHEEFHAIGGEQKNNISGCGKYDIPIYDIEHFDVENNTWVEETPLNVARFRFAAVAYNDSIYIFGGEGLVNTTTLIQPVLSDVMAWKDTNTYHNVPISTGVRFSISMIMFACIFAIIMLF